MLYMVKIAEGSERPKIYYAHPYWPFMMGLDGMPTDRFEAIYEHDTNGQDHPAIYVTETMDHLVGLPEACPKKIRCRMDFKRPTRLTENSPEYTLHGMVFVADFEDNERFKL